MIKKFLKKCITSALEGINNNIMTAIENNSYKINEMNNQLANEIKLSAINQIQLQMLYRILANESINSKDHIRLGNSELIQTMPKFNEIGFKSYSQNEEDGILLYIFALIGVTNKKCVEICAGDGVECNTANLIINHKWSALLFDGSISNVEKAKQYYSKHEVTKYWPPTVVHAWITRENINKLIAGNGLLGEIDLLSIDVDGVDYWLWKELNVVNPRVVVIEMNHLWGPNDSVTVPYDDNFVAEFTEYGSDYGGASISALIKLGHVKGYRFVGTNEYATNAFFIRNDINHNWLPEKSPSEFFGHPRAEFGLNVRFPAIKNKQWENI